VRLTDNQWESVFDEFASSAFRLEVQPTYAMADELDDLTLFLSGGSRPEGFNDDWHEYIRGHVAGGKTVQRVKLIQRPYTDYTRFTMAWGVPGNVESGEDYRIIDLPAGGTSPLPRQDFWLFDDEQVVCLDFDADGALLGIELIEEPDLDHYRRLRDLGLRLGTPFSDWHAGT
jgi:hypothetical protein